MNESNFESFYQFCPKEGYPVFVRFSCASIEAMFTETLQMMNFDIATKEQVDELESERGFRVLDLKEASLVVAKQILDFSTLMKSFGTEVTSRKNGYSIYVQDSSSMMVYSNDYTIWNAGIINHSDQDFEMRTLLTRYLSYALLELEVFGFWGVGVDEGFVVMRPESSEAQSIFIDMSKMKFICSDGVKSIKSVLQIFRLDPTLKQDSRKLTAEQLASFLVTNNAYLNDRGVDPRLRRLIFDLSLKAQGILYPEESFKPRACSAI